MSEVSLVRLYLLRAAYLLIAVLGVTTWMQILNHPMSAPGVVTSLLGAGALLAVVGLRYPVTMLPLLLWGLLWKSVWLLFFALPRGWSGTGTPMEATEAALFCALFLIVIPWRYVGYACWRRPGDPWTAAGTNLR